MQVFQTPQTPGQLLQQAVRRDTAHLLHPFNSLARPRLGIDTPSTPTPSLVVFLLTFHLTHLAVVVIRLLVLRRASTVFAGWSLAFQRRRISCGILWFHFFHRGESMMLGETLVHW